VSDLDFITEIDSKGRIEIPAAYVEMTELKVGESFQLKVGRKAIRLVVEGDSAIDWSGVHYKKDPDDGLLYLSFLTVPNPDGSHFIPEAYTELIEMNESYGQKYEIHARSEMIRLIPIED
jgi:bifunctional DNA-binding transcriptional regulator/antitoxin component of YhaV-PrlF toxin-antitoxin module